MSRQPNVQTGLGGLTPNVVGPATDDELEHERDARVSSEPEVVSPEPGKNVPEGQNTKG